MILLILLAPTLSHSLKCWQGWQNWNEEPVVDSVHLSECPTTHKCCAFVTSLNGNQFGCHETCPPKNYRQCGPDPRSGIQDLRYCYCRSHNDPRCTPFFETWDKRAMLTTPMPPEIKRMMAKNRLGFMMPKPVPKPARKTVINGAKIVGPPAPPAIEPLPPGIRPPAMIPVARPTSARLPIGRLLRPAARQLIAPQGKPVQRQTKKISPPK